VGFFTQFNTQFTEHQAVITLSVTPAEGLLGHDANLTFATTDVDGLKGLVTECKRLRDATGSFLAS
jgi:hypothetical protein